MKLTKQHWMIIGVVIALIAIWYFFLRKKKPAESGYNPYILVPEAGNWIDNSEPGGESAYSSGKKCWTETCPCTISNNKCDCATTLVKIDCRDVKNNIWGASGRTVKGDTGATKAFSTQRAESNFKKSTGMPGAVPSDVLNCHHTCPKVPACVEYNPNGTCKTWGAKCNCKTGLINQEQMGFGD